MEKKEDFLATDEAKVDEQISAAANLLREGAVRLSKETAARNMQEIEAASTVIERVNTKLSAIKKHRRKINYSQCCTWEE